MSPNPSNHKPVPVTSRESSSLRSPNDEDSVGKHWKKTAEVGKGVEDLKRYSFNLQRQLDRLRRRGGGEAEPGIHFDEKIEADPAAAIAYTRGTLVDIKPTHVLVTTGYRLPSAPGGAIVKARPGWWISTQDVPAKATDGGTGNEVYQVPQWPMPGADNDDELRFWTYFGSISC